MPIENSGKDPSKSQYFGITPPTVSEVKAGLNVMEQELTSKLCEEDLKSIDKMFREEHGFNEDESVYQQREVRCLTKIIENFREISPKPLPTIPLESEPELQEVNKDIINLVTEFATEYDKQNRLGRLPTLDLRITSDVDRLFRIFVEKHLIREKDLPLYKGYILQKNTSSV